MNYEDIQDTQLYHHSLSKEDSIEYITKYTSVITFFISNMNVLNFYKSDTYKHFVTYNGITSLLHIYNLLILHTKNINLAYYHLQKSYYYYIEFISQINKEQHSFLQFNIRDAIMFIYKKTIFNIDKDITIQNIDIDNKAISKDIFTTCNKLNQFVLCIVEHIRKYYVFDFSNESNIDYLRNIEHKLQEIIHVILNTNDVEDYHSILDKTIQIYNNKVFEYTENLTSSKQERFILSILEELCDDSIN